jgi:hypothetical protein
VVKRQSIIAWWRFRRAAQAATSRAMVWRSGIRRFKHWRAHTARSISALFHPRPCTGGMKLEFSRHPAGFRRREDVVERAWGMGTQMIQAPPALFRRGDMDVHQLGQTLGELLRGPLGGHRDMAPPVKRLGHDEKITGAVPGVFVVNARRVPRHQGHRLTARAPQVAGALIKTDTRAHGIIGVFVQSEEVFHPRDARGVRLGATPRLF